MPEQNWHPAATKFISSFVKLLHILYTGQVEFSESIELVGHINVRIDHKYNFDYIVNEQVSKEGEDSGTVFHSNSYHACPSSKLERKTASPVELVQGIIFSKLHHNTHERLRHPGSSQDYLVQPQGFSTEDTLLDSNETSVNYSVTVGSSDKQEVEANQIKFKSEGESNSGDCLFLPTSLVSQTNQVAHMSKCQQPIQQGNLAQEVIRVRSPEKRMHLSSSTKLKPASKITEDQENKISNNEFKKSQEPSNLVSNIKQLICKLAALCDISVVQDKLQISSAKNILVPSEKGTKSAKKMFLQSFDKEKMKVMKEVLKMNKGRQKKQQLRSLLAESGLSNEQLLILAQDSNPQRKRICWRSIPEGPKKETVFKEYKKAQRLKAQERQQRLLEMAEMLKRNEINDSSVTVVSKTGKTKCVLHKSCVSVVSHNTQQLSTENIAEISEALSGKTKETFVHSGCQNKSKDQLKFEYNRKTCVKKKMKQIIAKILREVSDAGYRVLVTSTIGSDAGSHSAELSVVPIKVDEFLSHTKEGDVRSELSEEEYAKQLEREHILEKQQANQEKMKQIEEKLVRILTGAEEIFIPTRKRYKKGEPRPSDAERMKEYRKKLKQDPERYQMYKQKRAMTKRKRRLGELAAKVKVSNSGPAVTLIPAAPITEEPHRSQPVSTLVGIAQPVCGVTMHCSQLYEHHNSHQPVNVHNIPHYVEQVSGIHNTHPNQQAATFGNHMGIVELITVSRSVQN